MIFSTTKFDGFSAVIGGHDYEKEFENSMNNTKSFRSLLGEQQRNLRVGWAARALAIPSEDAISTLTVEDSAKPLASGDLILTRVTSIGSHNALISRDAKRLRLYRDDVILGVAGSRYATDAFEAKLTPDGPMHLVTASGMCSTVLNRHSDHATPTSLDLIGRVCDASGSINLVKRCFVPRAPDSQNANVVFILGSGMNAGKTTTSRRLVKALLRSGYRVAACKLTGSVSHRDLYEYESTGAHDVRDFSHYGFPSTFGCSLNELEQLFLTMVADAQEASPDVIVMEIADGVLQKETAAILSSAVCRPLVFGTVLAAPCALSSLQGIQQITKHGHSVLAVSGLISNSPLMVREFEECCDVPFLTSSDQAVELAGRVASALVDRHVECLAKS